MRKFIVHFKRPTFSKLINITVYEDDDLKAMKTACLKMTEQMKTQGYKICSLTELKEFK